MSKVAISVIQLENEPRKKAENLDKAESLVREAAGRGAKIICLPELFVTGYNLKVFGEELYDMAEDLDGPSVARMRALAKELSVYIVAPIAMRKRGVRQLENCAVFIDDEGDVAGTYSKNHLFGDEPEFFTSNGKYPVFETKYGRVGIMICADNNFPEPARILALNGAEIIFMPAAWRVNEKDIWPLLIRSHACENNVFIAAANTFCRMDDLFLFGDSMIVGPRGNILSEAENEGSQALVETVDTELVYRLRADMPGLKDRRPEMYGALLRPVKA